MKRRLLGLIQRLAHAAAIGFAAYLSGVVVLRPWHRDWGSTSGERERSLPGDERAGEPTRAGDRAITIGGPASDVWPWLVQMGEDRGGFYSYTSLENAFGLHVVNADRIVPAWQRLEEGDFVRATPPDWLGGVFGSRIGWEVDRVERDRVLALRYWIFALEPVSDTSTRLHVRTHAGNPPIPVAPLLLLVFEPAHFVMERAMLLGIKQRSELISKARS